MQKHETKRKKEIKSIIQEEDFLHQALMADFGHSTDLGILRRHIRFHLCTEHLAHAKRRDWPTYNYFLLPHLSPSLPQPATLQAPAAAPAPCRGGLRCSGSCCRSCGFRNIPNPLLCNQDFSATIPGPIRAEYFIRSSLYRSKLTLNLSVNDDPSSQRLLAACSGKASCSLKRD